MPAQSACSSITLVSDKCHTQGHVKHGAQTKTRRKLLLLLLPVTLSVRWRYFAWILAAIKVHTGLPKTMNTCCKDAHKR